MGRLLITLAVAGLTTAASPAAATLIYENPLNVATGNGGAFSQADQALAAEFMLSHDATVTRASWSGTMLYLGPSMVGATWAFDLVFRFDESGLPGLSYVHAPVTASVSDTGVDVAGSRSYRFEATLAPFPLLAATPYWLSVLNTGTQATFRWTEATSGFATAFQLNGGSWAPFTAADQTPPNFALYDDSATAAVAEPSTLLLLGAGVVGLLRRRTRS